MMASSLNLDRLMSVSSFEEQTNLQNGDVSGEQVTWLHESRLGAGKTETHSSDSTTSHLHAFPARVARR
jgi:hypothetical protein